MLADSTAIAMPRSPAVATAVALAASAEFREVVEVAMVATAIAIQSEATTVPQHAERSRLAYRVLHGDPGLVGRMALALAAIQPSLVNNPSDDDVRSVVASVWNAFAVGGP